MNIGIILLGGSSKRLNLSTPKQFLQINNKELFEYSLETFIKNKNIERIVLVTGRNYYEHVFDIVNNKYNYKTVDIVIGGETRQESVLNALLFLEGKIKDDDKVLIHDSCRPLVTSRIINDHIKALEKNIATSTYINIYDSVIQKEGDFIKVQVPREDYFLVQTPQGFRFKEILEAHKEEKNNTISFTDDANLLVKRGFSVKLIEGDKFNFKITTFDDLMIVKYIIEAK